MSLTIEEKKSISLEFFSYINQFSQVLAGTIVTGAHQRALSIEQGFEQIIAMLVSCRAQAGTVYVVGNGGSAAIASHAVIDFLNMCKVRAIAMLDPAVTTCISNDFGYEHIYEKQILQFARKNDVLIGISSSGNSKNILNAVKAARSRGAKAITLSGFSAENLLRNLGDFNIWLNSTDYGQVEIGHAFVLHNLTDRLKQEKMCEAL